LYPQPILTEGRRPATVLYRHITDRDDSMLKAYASDTSGLRPVDDPTGALWIDLISPTPEEVAAAAKATGFQVPTEASAAEIESSSRLATRNGVLYLTMPLIHRSEDGPRGVPAGLVLSPTRLLTVRFAPSAIFDNFAPQDPNPTSGHILVALLEAIVDRGADGLEHVAHELDEISHRIFAMGVHQQGGRKQEDATLRATLGQIGHLGDLISHIRDTMVGAERIGPYVEKAGADCLPKDLLPRLKTLQQDITSLNDFDTHLNDKLQFLLDATMGFINIAQNNVMKVMTIASVVGIPPVLIAGIYGMNFKNIPEYDWNYGYAYGLAMIVVTTLIPLAVFRWRKWI
jgi:magnesium transporter